MVYREVMGCGSREVSLSKENHDPGEYWLSVRIWGPQSGFTVKSISRVVPWHGLSKTYLNLSCWIYSRKHKYIPYAVISQHQDRTGSQYRATTLPGWSVWIPRIFFVLCKRRIITALLPYAVCYKVQKTPHRGLMCNLIFKLVGTALS